MIKDVFTPCFSFTPDFELVKFAIDFSQSYKTFTAGDYFSDDKKYNITLSIL